MAPRTSISTSADACLAGPLARMFCPRAVALVGVSGRADSLNARPLRYLLEHGFAGAIYPVNPSYDSMQGLPCYRSLADLPGPVDLVLVLVPASQAAEVVRQAGAAGATAAVVFAAGFAETGQDGAVLQAELKEAGRAAGVRVLGPNCQGLLYGPTGLAATFTAAADRPIDSGGGVAYVGQSGAVGGCVMDLANEMGLGLTAWVSTGNQADLDLIDVAATLLEDPAIRVIMLYAESIGDGAAYTRLAVRARDVGKHLVVLRSGRSDAGRRATVSHTGTMLGEDIAFELASQRYGVVLADDLDALLAVAATVGSGPGACGPRVGVITSSGGAGSLAADHFASHALELPELHKSTQARLSEHVPDFAAVANPVDVTAQLFNREGHARAFGEICTIVANDPEVDVVAVVLTMVTGEAGAADAQSLVATVRSLKKPLFVAWLAGLEQTLEGRRIFRAAGIPVFGSVGGLARTVGLLAATAGHDRGDGANAQLDAQARVSAELLQRCGEGTAQGTDLLSTLGISQPACFLANDETQATEAATAIGAAVAMKICAPSLAHKSDLGGVRLGVTMPDVARTYHDLVATARAHRLADLEGVLVQEMVPPGVELIVGATSSQDGFPPVVTAGIGGVAAEIYQDVVTELAPVSTDQAEAMLKGLRGWPLLAGFRGRPTADVGAAAKAISSVSRMAAASAGQAIEFEINPLVVVDRGGGAYAVDLLVRADISSSRSVLMEGERSAWDE